MRRLGLGSRLTLWHALLVALVLAATALAADRLLARTVAGQVDAALLALAEAEVASAFDDPEERGHLREEPEARVHVHDVAGSAAELPARLDKLVQIVGAGGRVVARSANLPPGALPVPADLLARLADGVPAFDTVSSPGGEPIRVVSLPVEVEGRLRYAVRVGTPLTATLRFLRTARLLYAGAAAAILVAVVVSGGILTRRALLPIDHVVAMAREIGETSLGRRLPHPGTEDEVGRLVTTLNEMLARIERGFDAQRRFTADASHELRSPLTRLRTELEVTLRRPRSAGDYERALRSSREEVERLSRLASALLTLARLDAGEPPEASREPVLLGPLAEAEVRRFAPDAARKGVALVLEPAPPVAARAAPEALAVVVGNLLDNAIKFSPAGSRVSVRVSAGDGSARITVADQGPGVPLEAVPRLFDRFYRGDASRTPAAPGAGLGLAIARALVEAYGGRITVNATPGGGAAFTVSLPRDA